MSCTYPKENTEYVSSVFILHFIENIQTYLFKWYKSTADFLDCFIRSGLYCSVRLCCLQNKNDVQSRWYLLHKLKLCFSIIIIRAEHRTWCCHSAICIAWYLSNCVLSLKSPRWYCTPDTTLMSGCIGWCGLSLPLLNHLQFLAFPRA